MIAASKSVDVRYGECYGLLLIDESIFEKIFTSIQNGTSNWYLFTPRKTEIYHTGEESCMHPDRLINESNTGKIFDDDDGNPICTFSMTLTSPPWTMLRKVDMDDYELLVKVIRRVILIIAGVIHLFALALYHFWLKKFMFQFNMLLQGITRMGEGDLKPSGSASFTIEGSDGYDPADGAGEDGTGESDQRAGAFAERVKYGQTDTDERASAYFPAVPGTG